MRLILFAALALTACSSQPDPAAEEAAALNDAAEMLDTSPDSLAAPDETEGEANAVAGNAG